MSELVVKIGDFKIRAIILEKISRTKLRVKDIDRGVGWNENKKKYLGVKVPYGWFRGQNYGYGTEYLIHKKQIMK